MNELENEKEFVQKIYQWVAGDLESSPALDEVLRIALQSFQEHREVQDEREAEQLMAEHFTPQFETVTERFLEEIAESTKPEGE